MCSQTMMSSAETLQGFKVTKAFSGFPCERAAPQHTAELHRGHRRMDRTGDRSNSLHRNLGAELLMSDTQHIY